MSSSDQSAAKPSWLQFCHTTPRSLPQNIVDCLRVLFIVSPSKAALPHSKPTSTVTSRAYKRDKRRTFTFDKATTAVLSYNTSVPTTECRGLPTCPQARQLYRIANLHPPWHPVHTNAIKGEPLPSTKPQLPLPISSSNHNLWLKKLFSKTQYTHWRNAACDISWLANISTDKEQINKE